MPGQEGVLAANGPIARTLGDVEMYSKAVVAAEPWRHDPKCLPIPWRPVELPSRLKVAIMWDDGMTRPTPPIMRAMKETRAKLEAAGHEVVDWDATGHEEAFTTLLSLLGVDGAESIRRPLEHVGEPWLPQLQIFRELKVQSALEVWQLQNKRSVFQAQYHDAWQAAGIDAIVCPTMPFVTARHGQSRHSEWFFSFSMWAPPPGQVAGKRQKTLLFGGWG
jgi:amidase